VLRESRTVGGSVLRERRTVGGSVLKERRTGRVSAEGAPHCGRVSAEGAPHCGRVGAEGVLEGPRGMTMKQLSVVNIQILGQIFLNNISCVKCHRRWWASVRDPI